VLSLVLASAEPSKVPFYVSGIALAAWAVTLAAIGITHPGFPGSDSRMRLVIGVSVVLTVLTIGLAIHTSAFIHSS
jgi:hypothetical protein